MNTRLGIWTTVGVVAALWTAGAAAAEERSSGDLGANYPLTKCVVSRRKLPGQPVDYLHKNKLVRLCCNRCVVKFARKPNTYLKKIARARARKGDADGTWELDVEMGCATCIYKMEGVSGCKGAVKVGGRALLFIGAALNAHAVGLCAAAKKAVVTGKVKGDEFIARSFEFSDDGGGRGGRGQ